jgi:hypothetical protein
LCGGELGNALKGQELLLFLRDRFEAVKDAFSKAKVDATIAKLNQLGWQRFKSMYPNG